MNVLVRWWSDREVKAIRDQVQGRLPITSDGVRKVLHAAEAVPAVDYLKAVDQERIARALAECIVGVQVRREDEPVDVSRVHRDLAAYIVRGQS